MANRATNLAMSMQLSASDPYSLLHGSCWGTPDKESDYIKTDTIDVPTEDNLSVVEPHEFRILDFGSQCPILPDRTFKMLIRDEYIELWKRVESDRHNPRRRFGGVVLTGHPGIGKSFGLYFYLIQNLLAAQPIALQTDKNSFFVFIESGVYLVRFTSNTAIYDIQSHLKQLGCTEGMISLVDSSERSPSPAPIFLDPRLPFYVIQATAPRPYRWADWVEQNSATVLVTKPWSWKEIFIGSRVSLDPELPVADLHGVFEKYGPVPRVCFHLVGDEQGILAYEHDLRRSLVGSPPLVEVTQTNGFTEKFSSLSSILLMLPNSSRLPVIKPASRYITRVLASCITVADASEMCAAMASEALTKKTGQDLFETVVVRRIMDGTLPYDFYFSSPLSPLIPIDKIHLQKGKSPIIPCSPITCDSIPTSPIPDHSYFFDQQSGNHLCDALISTYNGRQNTLHLLKVVADYTSPIFLEELDLLASKMPPYLSLPTSHRKGFLKWKLVFIVPSCMQKTFAKQSFQGVGKFDWEKSPYFSQFVAGI